MKYIKLIPLLLISLLHISCSEMILGPDPENTPESNFDILWQDFDKTYSLFEIKNVNWDSLYSVFRPRVSSQTSDRQLLGIMSEMLDNLKDGHVNVLTPVGTYSYNYLNKRGWKKSFPGFSIIASKYLKSWNSNNIIAYGPLTDEIGYIYISSFSDASNESQYFIIDKILQAMSGMKAFVVDIRCNGGGSDLNSTTIASRFADKKRLYRYFKYKNGPGHGDFARLHDDYIEPAGSIQFVKPVALLTDRYVFSAAEDFVFAMKEFPHVTVMGDTTGGGFGNPVYRELPNGWKYRFSRWVQYDSKMKCYEDTGYPPDIPVRVSEDEMKAGKDLILERAAEYLKGKLQTAG